MKTIRSSKLILMMVAWYLTMSLAQVDEDSDNFDPIQDEPSEREARGFRKKFGRLAGALTGGYLGNKLVNRFRGEDRRDWKAYKNQMKQNFYAQRMGGGGGYGPGMGGMGGGYQRPMGGGGHMGGDYDDYGV